MTYRNDPQTIAKLLRACATGSIAKANKHDVIFIAAAELLEQSAEPFEEAKEEPKQGLLLQRQSNEFTALSNLAIAYQQMPVVVDDDYPAGRHKYEGALYDFLEAVFRNRRADGRFILLLRREGLTGR
jgi:hypothetical protein